MHAGQIHLATASLLAGASDSTSLYQVLVTLAQQQLSLESPQDSSQATSEAAWPPLLVTISVAYQPACSARSHSTWSRQHPGSRCWLGMPETRMRGSSRQQTHCWRQQSRGVSTARWALPGQGRSPQVGRVCCCSRHTCQLQALQPSRAPTAGAYSDVDGALSLQGGSPTSPLPNLPSRPLTPLDGSLLSFRSGARSLRSNCTGIHHKVPLLPWYQRDVFAGGAACRRVRRFLLCWHQHSVSTRGCATVFDKVVLDGPNPLFPHPALPTMLCCAVQSRRCCCPAASTSSCCACPWALQHSTLSGVQCRCSS